VAKRLKDETETGFRRDFCLGVSMLSENEIVQWRRFAPSLVALDFCDRTVIYGQGDRPEHLFWLLKGIVKLSHITEGGMQLTTAVLGPGGVFGSTLDTEASEHTATALGDIRVARIAHADLGKLVAGTNAFATALFAELESQQKRTQRKLVDLLTKTVETRLVETLHELALVFGAPCTHGYALEIRLTQQDIADLVHASRPVVTRAMNALRRRGVLDYRRALICVNQAALRPPAPPRSTDL
jgi:CRP/FNR family cyclic AMP-dependent transcriptional regulator